MSRIEDMLVQAEAPKEEVKPPTVVFCLPGNKFSGNFLDSWTETISQCLLNGLQFKISRRESPVVYYVRNLCLGGDTLRGPDQKPFNGELDYTHLMWIDSDIVFSPQQMFTLLNHDKDIVSGVYAMQNSEFVATVKEWDEEYFAKNGSFQFMSIDEISKRKSLFKAAYTGFGFVLIKKGIFEAMNYPWFEPLAQKIGTAVDFTSEDTSFCLKAKELGFDIWVDPTIRVGHEKPMIL